MTKIFPIRNALIQNSKTTKKIIPVVSSLSVLAGSSMGPGNPMHDVGHVPGSSVDDTCLEKFEYFGDKLIDLGKETGNLLFNGAEKVSDEIIDFSTTAIDSTSDLANDIIDGIIDIFV